MVPVATHSLVCICLYSAKVKKESMEEYSKVEIYGSKRELKNSNRGILADVIVYIFAHLHRALRTEGKVLDIN